MVYNLFRLVAPLLKISAFGGTPLWIIGLKFIKMELLAAPLASLRGTLLLLCRGTPVGNHCLRSFKFVHREKDKWLCDVVMYSLTTWKCDWGLKGNRTFQHEVWRHWCMTIYVFLIKNIFLFFLKLWNDLDGKSSNDFFCDKNDFFFSVHNLFLGGDVIFSFFCSTFSFFAANDIFVFFIFFFKKFWHKFARERENEGDKIADLESISPTFYMQLLRKQIPKAQKDSQVKQLFCTLGICESKSCS